jgi:hypothetical protein
VWGIFHARSSFQGQQDPPLCEKSGPLTRGARASLQMKKPLMQAATRKFGEGVPQVDRILELEVGVESIVIGTLYKEMKVSYADAIDRGCGRVRR